MDYGLGIGGSAGDFNQYSTLKFIGPSQNLNLEVCFRRGWKCSRPLELRLHPTAMVKEGCFPQAGYDFGHLWSECRCSGGA
jgi:hypothetical protein